MKEPVYQLNPSSITSDVFIIAPTQIEYIARMFADRVADEMALRTFAPKMRIIAEEALRSALKSARHMGQ